MAKAFASQGDLTEKKITFEELAPNCYAYTTEGDPNAGVVIGDDCVMVIEALATPVQAQRLIDKIREITDKPIKHLVLSHYHAVRVMGASAYNAQNIIASDKTYNLIVERGEADFKSEVERFPRLFEAVETVPGLTWPTMVFKDELTIHMGKTKVQILALGGGHTAGDTVIWVPEHRVLYSGDEIEWDCRAGAGSGCARPRRGAPKRGGEPGGDRKHPRLRDRVVQPCQTGCRQKHGAKGSIRFRLVGDGAEIRQLGNLPALYAVQCEPCV